MASDGTTPTPKPISAGVTPSVQWRAVTTTRGAITVPVQKAVSALPGPCR